MTRFAFDIETGRRFVAALTGSPDSPIRLRFIDDNKDRKPKLKPDERFGTLDKLRGEIEAFQSQGYACFYLVNETPAALSHDGMAKDEDVTRVRAVFCDFDEGLPLTGWHIQPSLIVVTSPGKAQALWLPDKEVPLDQFKQIEEQLLAHYPEADRAVKNPSRILRLPGSWHQKVDSEKGLTGEPHRVTFEGDGRRISDVTEGLAAGDAPERTEASSLKGEPVEWEKLVERLKYIPADVPYPLWSGIVAAIRATNSGTEDQRLALAIAWSCGALHGGTPVRRWKGEKPVKDVWRTMPSERRDGKPTVGFGTIDFAARQCGYQGPPVNLPSHLPEGSEVFADYLTTATTETADDWRRVTDTLASEPVPVREIIPGLIERGIVTFLAGAGGSMKSRLGLQWGLCVDAGAPVWGRPVERATFVYLSCEDHPDEVQRRMHAANRRLGLPEDKTAIWLNKVGAAEPLAIVGDRVELQPFRDRFVTKLKSIPGHKFIVIDSTYNALLFTGNAKINEASVQMGIGVLSQICRDADATIVTLWHPSQSGQERGDASGWSVAWHNAPRARLSISRVKEDSEGTFLLKVEKRNNAPKGEPITLHWSDGALLPPSQTTTEEQRSTFRTACVDAAIAAAEQGAPIQRQRDPDDWVFKFIATATGRRPTKRELKQELAAALHDRQLRYLGGSKSRVAGYYPFEEQRAEIMASAAKKGTGHTDQGVRTVQ
jgi:RecA-family ATPase